MDAMIVVQNAKEVNCNYPLLKNNFGKYDFELQATALVLLFNSVNFS